MEPVSCEFCGKTLHNLDEVYSFKHKKYCHDCYKDAKNNNLKVDCFLCSHPLNQDNFIRINHNAVCIDCAFKKARIDYDSFKSNFEIEYKQRQPQRKKQKRNIIICSLLISVAISVITGIVFVLFNVFKGEYGSTVNTYSLIYLFIDESIRTFLPFGVIAFFIIHYLMKKAIRIIHLKNSTNQIILTILFQDRC